jgi:hypothetical protein
MFVNNFSIYPFLDNKKISIVLTVNMREDYKEIFGVDSSFESFIEMIKKDKLTLKIAMEILYEYYGFKKMPVITDSSYEKWYFVKYSENVKDTNYNYYLKIGNMNKKYMLGNYVDLFNNKIEYKIA